MCGKYYGFVSKARVSACMYFLVFKLKQRFWKNQTRTPGNRAKYLAA
jgi:hypothetical protein